jgi:hypothetical protein
MGQQENDIEAVTTVIRHLDSGNPSTEVNMNRVV